MATPLPVNRARLTLTEILAATGGAVRGPLGDRAMHIEGISTDTRQLTAGSAFVALAGERFDGHDHLAAAAERGAALALVERDVPAPAELTLLKVASTLETLRALASHHLERWRALGGERRVIAITGSAGKTTTKKAVQALLGRALGDEGAVWTAAGNLNNLVGVPLVALALEPHHRYAVFELGTNRPGEIGKLARTVRPDLGILTLIASAHAQELGSIEGVAGEKGALYAELAGAIAVGNVDDERVGRALAASLARERVGYGHGEPARYRILGREPAATGARLTLARADGSRVTVDVPLLGRAGALACAAGLASVETLLDVRLDAASVGEALAPLGGDGRLALCEAASGLVVIDDSYNANPASAASSIEAAAELARQRERALVLVLGEMLELGRHGPAAHDELGERAARSGARIVIAVAGEARRVAERAHALGVEAWFAADADEAAELALVHAQATDVVLVKGSRSVRTERVVAALLDRHGRDRGASPGPCAGVRP